LRSKRVIPSIAWDFGLPPPPASPSPGRALSLVVWDGWRSPLVTCSHWPLVARSLRWLVTCQSPLVTCSLGWVPGGRNGRGFGMVAAACEAMPLANAFPIQGFWNVCENWRLYRIRARLQSCRERPSPSVGFRGCGKSVVARSRRAGLTAPPQSAPQHLQQFVVRPSARRG